MKWINVKEARIHNEITYVSNVPGGAIACFAAGFENAEGVLEFLLEVGGLPFTKTEAD